MLKRFTYIAGVFGLAFAVWLTVRSGLKQTGEVLASTGGQLLWLLPLHAIVLLPDVAGWRLLLAPRDPDSRAPTAYLFWVATVREAINRLLPVANIGGELVGIHLVMSQGIGGAAVASSVIVETLLAMFSQYFFAVIGICILLWVSEHNHKLDAFIWGLILSLIVPVLLTAVLRYVPVFKYVNRLSGHLLGPANRVTAMLRDSMMLDDEILRLFGMPRRLVASGGLQLLGMLIGAFEVGYGLSVLGHPVTPAVALMIESLIQAVRQVVFIVPSGLGVQEMGLIVLGQISGFDASTAVTLSLVKRLREVLFGIPALLSWQWSLWRRRPAFGAD